MTEGVTQAARDSDLIKKVDNIKDLEERFNEKESVELAEEIIDNLLDLRDMQNGYYNYVKYKAVIEGLNKYGTYLSKRKQ